MTYLRFMLPLLVLALLAGLAVVTGTSGVAQCLAAVAHLRFAAPLSSLASVHVLVPLGHGDPTVAWIITHTVRWPIFGVLVGGGVGLGLLLALVFPGLPILPTALAILVLLVLADTLVGLGQLILFRFQPYLVAHLVYDSYWALFSLAVWAGMTLFSYLWRKRVTPHVENEAQGLRELISLLQDLRDIDAVLSEHYHQLDLQQDGARTNGASSAGQAPARARGAHARRRRVTTLPSSLFRRHRRHHHPYAHQDQRYAQ